jgi:beta-alanine degradation protein BauB
MFAAGVLAGGAITSLAWSGALQATGLVQPVKSEDAKVVLENDKVRVRDVTFAPGVTYPMHTHKWAHVGVIIQGGTLVLTGPDGKAETLQLAPGGAGYREANVTHAGSNPGKSPVRVIEVEVK